MEVRHVAFKMTNLCVDCFVHEGSTEDDLVARLNLLRPQEQEVQFTGDSIDKDIIAKDSIAKVSSLKDCIDFVPANKSIAKDSKNPSHEIPQTSPLGRTSG